MYWINKFGYDPKQLHHLLRVEEYLQRYIAGESYEACLTPKYPEYLKQVKEGLHSLEAARKLAKAAYENIHQTCDYFIEQNKDKPINEEINELLDDVAYEIMKISIKEDFNETR